MRLMGQLHPDPRTGDGSQAVKLPPARMEGGLPLAQGTVIRAWIDRHALSQAMQLGADQQVLLAQTGGWPAEVTST